MLGAVAGGLLLGAGGISGLGARGVELLAGAEFAGAGAEQLSINLESLTFSLARTCIRDRYRLICDVYLGSAAFFM